MESRAQVAGHPIHPMLVVFPIGLWVFSFVADLFYFSGADPSWSTVAYYAMAGGILGALAAAIPGAIDLFSMPAGHVRRIGMMHMAINLTVVVLYVINFWLRSTADADATGPVWMSGFAVALLVVSGWLGGELVYRHGVGVNASSTAADNAHRVAARHH